MAVADLRCLFVILRCLLSELRCVLSPCTLTRSNSYFGEEVAPTFEKEKLVDTHFCYWLVSISLQSTLEGNISTKNNGSKSYHVRLPDPVFFSCPWTTQQPHGFSKKVKQTLEASSRTIRDARFLANFPTRVWLSSWKCGFFVKVCLVLVNAHSCFNNLVWIL